MQVRVKTPHIRVDISGEDIPAELIEAVRAVFEAKDIEIFPDAAEEYVNYFATDEHRDIARQTSPGDVVKIYRENRGWSQAKLGAELGGMSRQNVSDIERGRRPISGATAIALSRVFQIPVDRFYPRGLRRV